LAVKKNPSLPRCRFIYWLTAWLVLLPIGLKAEEKQVRAPGRIVIAKVLGTVTAENPSQKISRTLKTNDVISDEYTVTSAPESSAILVFSNGSTVKVNPDTILVIEEFLQDPFANSVSMSSATEEPSTSVTRLNLKKGALVCNVKKLRTAGENGSSFTVKTPVGAAGIRGTTFAIEFIPGTENTGIFTLSVTEGEVVLSDNKGAVSPVVGGKSVVITATTNTNETGVTRVVSQSDASLQDIPPATLNTINQSVQEISNTSQGITIPSSSQAVSIDNPIPNPSAPQQTIPEPVRPKPVTDVDP
jgi:hypothetical protein